LHKQSSHNVKAPENQGLLHFLAVRTGLEPATHGVTGRYSNQLNYRTIFKCHAKVVYFLIPQKNFQRKYFNYARHS
jgi:hypothetical protein